MADMESSTTFEYIAGIPGIDLGVSLLALACHEILLVKNDRFRTLIQHPSVNVNAGLYGRRNFTALHLLISENTRHSPHDYEIECLAQLIERVSLLLQAGADTSLRDQDGFTPLDIAEEERRASARKRRASAMSNGVKPSWSRRLVSAPACKRSETLSMSCARHSIS